MSKDRTLAENKRRGERMYLRLGANERAARWEMIVAHAVSLMTTGKPAFNPNAGLKIEVLEVAAEKAAEAAAQMVSLTEDVTIRTPVSEAPCYTNAPSGTFDHDYYHNMYRYIPPTESGKTTGDTPFIPCD